MYLNDMISIAPGFFFIQCVNNDKSEMKSQHVAKVKPDVPYMLGFAFVDGFYIKQQKRSVNECVRIRLCLESAPLAGRGRV